MKKLRIYYVVALFTLLLYPCSALALGIEAAIGFWNMKPQGDLGYQGRDLSLEDDLLLGYQTKPSGRLKADMPLMIPNIYLMFTQKRNTGSGKSSEDFSFAKNYFSKDIPLSSKLNMNSYDVALYYGIPFLKGLTLGRISAEAGLNVKIVDIDVTVTQSGTSESKSYTVPIPMAYLGAQTSVIGGLSLEAEARLIALGSADHYYDLLGRIKYKVFGPAFMAGGYRYEDVQLDRKDLRVSKTIGGPFFEIGFSF